MPSPPGEGWGCPAARLMIYTLMSSEVDRILTIEPGRSAAGEQDRRKRLPDTIFPQQMNAALTRRPEIRVRRSSKTVSPCADGQRLSSLTGQRRDGTFDM